MKIRSFKNPFGSINYICIKSIELSSFNIKSIIDIFNCKKVMLSLVALERDCAFVNMIKNSKDAFDVILPDKDSIISEVIIVAEFENLLTFWEQLIDAKPRNIIVYGLKDWTNIKNVLLGNGKERNNEQMLLNCEVDFILSALLDETLTLVSFNRESFAHKRVLKEIRALTW